MIAMVLALLPVALVLPRHVYADIEWNVKKQLKLQAAAVDVVSSPDGKWIFVLTPGEILAYSVPEYEIVNRIPVEKSFDRLAFSEQENTLVVTSSSDKLLKLIQVDVVHRFDLAGLPFRGPENARVVIAVFSDYQ